MPRQATEAEQKRWLWVLHERRIDPETHLPRRSISEIADELGVSRAQVCKLEKKGRRLREKGAKT